jgi:hypothetical protein
MKIGTFSEAFHPLRANWRKKILENRVMRIFLWCQLALMLGIFCLYLVLRICTAYAVGQIEVHPDERASIDWCSNVGWIGFWLLAVGLPILAMILGIGGVLPGTHRKKSL